MIGVVCPTCQSHAYPHCPDGRCGWYVCFRRDRCGGYGQPDGRWWTRTKAA